jgi:hypothetical protein
VALDFAPIYILVMHIPVSMRFTFLLLVFLLSLVLSGQTVDVVADLEGPSALTVVGNKLYFTQNQGGKLSRIDLSEETPTVVDLLENLAAPYGLADFDGYLYYAENSGGQISRIPLDDDTPSPEIILRDLTLPSSLTISEEGVLYFAQFSMGEISRLDLTDPDDQGLAFVLGLRDPTGLAVIGDTLFFSDFAAGSFAKVDRTAFDPIPRNLFNDLPGINYLLAEGDEIYIGMFTNNEVLRYDRLSGRRSQVLADIDSPTGMAVFAGQLYISSFGGNKIVRLDRPLSTFDAPRAPTSLFPNPTRNQLWIVGAAPDRRLQLLNARGVLVRQLNGVGSQQSLDLSNLAAGIYYLRWSDGQVQRFIKQ